MSTTTAAPAALAGATPPVRGSTPARLLKGELLKIWTTNSWWIFGILTVVFTGLALLINLYQAHDEITYAQNQQNQPMPDFGKNVPPGENGPSPEEIARSEAQYLDSINVAKILVRNAANVYTSGQFFGLLFMVILGALIVTNEFFHQTATTTFLTTPHRSRVIFGKLAAAVVLAFGFWLVITALDLVVGSIFFSASSDSVPLTDWPVLRSVLMNLLAFVIWAVLGVGLGVLIRSQLGATLTGAAAYLLSFPIAFTLFSLIRQFVIQKDWVWQWIVAVPGVASQVMISPEPLRISFDTVGPSWWEGALVLVAYGVAAGIIGTLITRKRDIS